MYHGMNLDIRFNVKGLKIADRLSKHNMLPKSYRELENKL